MANRRKSDRSSITEVSKEAGVSIATVSRVINGHPHVSEDTVNAVQAAIKRMGYRASAGSARHRNGEGIRTGNIAVLFPDVNQEALRTPLSGRLMHGIDEVLRQNGMTMIVTGLQPDLSAPSCMTQRKVDGVIVRGSRMAAELKDLLSLLPSVWVFEAGYRAGFEMDMICEDNALIGAMAAQRLYENGHRRLCVFNFEPDHASMRVRRMFFVEEAEQLGCSVQTVTAPKEDMAKVLDRVMSKTDRPNGLFVPGTDNIVIDFYRGLEERRLHVGKDLELISVNNDINRLWTLNPTLTNIDIHAEMIGRAAVDTLLWRLSHANEPKRKVVIPPTMTENLAHRATNGRHKRT